MRGAAVNYSKIKALAKELKVSFKDLIALAPCNDPFYMGQAAQIEKAEWFHSIWEAGSFPTGVHLRRIHYWLVSQKTPWPMRDGKPYENTIECWAVLTAASKPARYLDLVPVSAFDDRRNPEPQIFEPEECEDISNWVNRSALEADGLVMPDLPSIFTNQPDEVQRYQVEIWCEKSTMNDVLLPICRRYQVNLITGLGELSITAVDRLFDRLRETGKPTRILYLSDFDPAGQSMPVAVSRKAEFMAQGTDADIQLHTLALSAEQVREYDLPRVPIKETERRKEKFEKRHGQGATELDALEAIHPGVLGRLVTESVLQYRDETLARRTSMFYREECERAEQIDEAVYAEREEDIDRAKDEWQAIQTEIDQWKENNQPLWTDIANELADRMPADFELPEPIDKPDDTDPLFDSTRDYMTQIRHYRAFQGRDQNKTAVQS
jgi:hypothetical protein